MRLLKPITLATRLTRAGKLTEALAALGGGLSSVQPPTPASAWPAWCGAAPDASTLRATLDAGLGALGRIRNPATPGTASPMPEPSGANFTQHISAGGLVYKLYKPRNPGTTPLPLVVMLHGCTQSPDDFATGTRMNALAEREGVLVAYPAQSRAANAQKCWNWFRAVDQGRAGEPALVVSMVDEISAHHAVARARVYVAGLSAGGAAAAVLGQAYPEVFAAVGVHSGLACGAAQDMGSAFAAMRGGASRTLSGASIPTIVFHGDGDTTVAPINGTQVAAQALPADHLTHVTETATTTSGQSYTRTVRADADGIPQLEHWVLHGASHAWAGGDPAGSYTDPRGPDASAAMLRFFRHHVLKTATQ